jgi:ATP-dependent RNA helicase DOB1
VVIALLVEPMEVAQAEAMVSGEGAPLLSAFQLSYSMLLNMTKLEGIETEYILARCVPCAFLPLSMIDSRPLP